MLACSEFYLMENHGNVLQLSIGMTIVDSCCNPCEKNHKYMTILIG